MHVFKGLVEMLSPQITKNGSENRKSTRSHANLTKYILQTCDLRKLLADCVLNFFVNLAARHTNLALQHTCSYKKLIKALAYPKQICIPH